jgi:cystathionine beta-lyase/cystathionine gamma-synthase
VGTENVYYIGLPSHPQHPLVLRQMSGFGGMISVELGSRERAAHVLNRVRVFSLAESLGGVESLISQPAGMTHASVPPDRRAALGITDGLIRLSCGVEDAADLLADLEQAFEGLPALSGRPELSDAVAAD